MPHARDTSAIDALELRPRPSRRKRQAKSGPLRSGSGCVICLDAVRVQALHVDASGEAVVVKQVREEVVDHMRADAQHPWRALSEAFGRCIRKLPRNLRPFQLMVLAPPARVRTLHLPELQGRKLINLARYQLAQGESLESTAQVLGPSFEGSEQGLAVRAAGIPEGLLAELRREALIHGVPLKRICTRPAGGPALVAAFGKPEASSGRYMLLELGRYQLRLTMVSDGGVRFTRTLDVVEGASTEELVTRMVTEVQRTNIFLGGRFRERPGEHLVLIAHTDVDLATLGERLEKQLQVPLHCVPARVRAVSAGSLLPFDLVADAGSLVLGADPRALGATCLRARSRRWMGLAAVACSVLICVLQAGGLVSRGLDAAQGLENTRERITALRSELAGLPDHAAALASQEARRDALLDRIEDLVPLLPPSLPAERLLHDLLGRLPAEIVVSRVKVTTHEVSGRRIIEISGWSAGTLSHAARSTPRTLAALVASPWVTGGRDLSGDYDPFNLWKSGKVPLYPVRFKLSVEDRP